jgi:hypothetical protein
VLLEQLPRPSQSLLPELEKDLRDGDLLTGRLFCAQLFDCDGRRNRVGEVIVGLVNSGWVKMATRSPIYPEIRLRERCASTRRRAENADRLLEDQFDSHLSPFAHGNGFQKFQAARRSLTISSLK